MNISETIKRLRTMRTVQMPAFTRNGTGRLELFDGYSPNPGRLDAHIYVPETLQAQAPLVVVLHGCTQTAVDYDTGSGWSHLADELGFALLFPQQTRRNNPNLCFNWFNPSQARRDKGEAASIRHMIEAMVKNHGLNREKIFVTGLSAGGAMTSVMLAAYPEVFAGGAIIAGLPFASANTIPEAFASMQGQNNPGVEELQQRLKNASPHEGPWPKISIWHGTSDPTVHPSNVDMIVGQWLAAHDVPETAASSDIVDGFPRRLWKDSRGREVIEEFSISGMGHGTPRHNEDGGAAGPYMLDMGISSTRHIARFWGLLDKNDSISRAARSHTLTSKSKLAAQSIPVLPPVAAPARIRHEDANSAPKPVRGLYVDVSKTINDALRAAGLMK